MSDLWEDLFGKDRLPQYDIPPNSYPILELNAHIIPKHHELRDGKAQAVHQDFLFASPEQKRKLKDLGLVFGPTISQGEAQELINQRL